MSVTHLSWTCARCEAVNDLSDPACEHCGAARRSGAAPSRPALNVCARCAGESPSVSEFHPGDEAADPQDRGVRLCPACWIPALRRRAARDPISAEDRRRLIAAIHALEERFPSSRVD